jgi:hypothetical protein
MGIIYTYIRHVYFNKLTSFPYILPLRIGSAWLIVGHHIFQEKHYEAHGDDDDDDDSNK